MVPKQLGIVLSRHKNLPKMNYHFSKKVSYTFEDAVEKVEEELKKQGFGIISRINIQEIFRKKLNTDFRKYIILGACNPQFAYEALQEEDKMGIFLPCNVVLQEHADDEVEISVINPVEVMNSTGNLNLKTFAEELKESLKWVLDQV
jgi:uncharacterized protein (DUF302 family)